MMTRGGKRGLMFKRQKDLLKFRRFLSKCQTSYMNVPYRWITNYFSWESFTITTTLKPKFVWYSWKKSIFQIGFKSMLRHSIPQIACFLTHKKNTMESETLYSYFVFKVHPFCLPIFTLFCQILVRQLNFIKCLHHLNFNSHFSFLLHNQYSSKCLIAQ